MKIFEAWVSWHVATFCNLGCEYCLRKTKKIEDTTKSIDIPKLLTGLSSTKKTLLVTFSGKGEPFIISNLVDTLCAVTEDHYVSIHTNLTQKSVKDFCARVPISKVWYIWASLHVEQLEKLGILSTYAENFLACKKKGFNIGAHMVAYPTLFKKGYKEKLKLLGIEAKYELFKGTYDGREFPEGYTDEELSYFNLERSNCNLFRQKGKYCNAGYNAVDVLQDGTVINCLQRNKVLGNIYEKFNFDATIPICSAEYCDCPLNFNSHILFKRALLDNKIYNVDKTG